MSCLPTEWLWPALGCQDVTASQCLTSGDDIGYEWLTSPELVGLDILSSFDLLLEARPLFPGANTLKVQPNLFGVFLKLLTDLEAILLDITVKLLKQEIRKCDIN